MKTAKLVIGIISIVLFVIIAFQSCFAGVVEAIEDEGGTSGSAGIILALSMLIAGIVGIAARKSKGGTITAGVFYIFGAIIGFANMGVYADLAVWSFVSLVFGALFILFGVRQKKAPKNVPDNTQNVPTDSNK